MQKKKKKLQKTELKERESQKELIYLISIRECEETVNGLYGTDRAVLTITIPVGMLQNIRKDFPMFDDNKSACLAYIMNQGLVRMKEHYARQNKV